MESTPADSSGAPYLQSMAHYFEELAVAPFEEAAPVLADLLRKRDDGTNEKHIVPRLACRALLHHGPAGVRLIHQLLPEAPGAIYPKAMLEALWFAARGALGSDMFGVASLSAVLMEAPSAETTEAASLVMRDLLAESRVDDDLFWRLIDFTSETAGLGRGSNDAMFTREVREFFAEATIRLTPSLLREFERMISFDLREEAYQVFLAENPVLLDPLADAVVPKQRMGLEHITDFAIRRLDNRWLLVEIEKPQDAVFTAGNDFTGSFTHGYGQVLDFQRWVEDNGAYAQQLMSGIASPTGLLVIGRRSALNASNEAKLRRFVANSRTIDVLTFDDVYRNAAALYRNLYYRPHGH